MWYTSRMYIIQLHHTNGKLEVLTTDHRWFPNEIMYDPLKRSMASMYDCREMAELRIDSLTRNRDYRGVMRTVRVPFIEHDQNLMSVIFDRMNML